MSGEGAGSRGTSRSATRREMVPDFLPFLAPDGWRTASSRRHENWQCIRIDGARRSVGEKQSREFWKTDKHSGDASNIPRLTF